MPGHGVSGSVPGSLSRSRYAFADVIQSAGLSASRVRPRAVRLHLADVSFGVPEQLREISTRIWEGEREKAAQVMAEAAEEIQQVLRAAMGELVAHMRDRLKDGPGGKPLNFKESTVAKLSYSWARSNFAT